MTDDQLLELINSDLDGELSTEQQQLLSRIRAERPDVIQLRDEMQQVIDKVQSLRAVEPPGYLKNQILAALPQQATPVRRQEGFVTGFIDSIRSLFQPRYALQLATIFAAGLAVGIVLMRAGSFSNSVDPVTATGTIGASQKGANTASFTLEGVNGMAAVSVTRRNGQIVIRVEGTVQDPFDLDIRVAPELAVLRGFTEDPTGVGSEITSAPGIASIKLAASGVASFTFEVVEGHNETPLSFSLTSEGKGVVTKNVTI